LGERKNNLYKKRDFTGRVLKTAKPKGEKKEKERGKEKDQKEKREKRRGS